MGDEPQPPQSLRLRDALIEITYQRPLEQVSLDELLARADVGPDDFHAEFTDLEDCFCKIYAVERDKIVADIVVARAPYEAWRDRLRAAAYSLYRSVIADEKLTYFIFVGGRNAGERAYREVEAVMEPMFDFLDEGRMEKGAGPGVTSRATAEAMGATIWNQISLAAVNSVPLEESVVQHLMYATVLPYLGPEAAQEELELPPMPVHPSTA